MELVGSGCTLSENMGSWALIEGICDRMTQKMENLGVPPGDLLLLAGPCSAESEEQVLSVARSMANTEVNYLRAGLWKPRTRPGSFEGVGLRGLAWMDRARSETGLKIASEVAEPSHVDACLQFGMDLVWVGARTTTNPFSVQALADALKGCDIPVLVKNPMNEDVGLWIGALERLANAGVKNLGAIHRGVSSTREIRYRNAPAWKMPIELMRRMPEVPVICDPSHICGKSELIAEVAQEAMDLLFSGLMVEVHPDPASALSDAAQQLTPSAFLQMISSLRRPHEQGGDAVYEGRMSLLRKKVDEMDAQLLELVAQRMEVVREMGTLKSLQNVSTLQPHRWQEVLKERKVLGEKLGLSCEFVGQVMQTVHEEAIRLQEERRLKSI